MQPQRGFWNCPLSKLAIWKFKKIYHFFFSEHFKNAPLMEIMHQTIIDVKIFVWKILAQQQKIVSLTLTVKKDMSAKINVVLDRVGEYIMPTYIYTGYPYIHVYQGGTYQPIIFWMIKFTIMFFFFDIHAWNFSTKVLYMSKNTLSSKMT